jgi:hypothetical protein
MAPCRLLHKRHIYWTLARNTDANVYVKWLFMVKQLLTLLTADFGVLSSIYRYLIMTLTYIYADCYTNVTFIGH